MDIKKYKKNNKGQIFLMAVVFFVFISLPVIFSFAIPTLSEYKNAIRLLNSKKSYYVAESGVEDVVYRIKKGELYDINEVLNINGLYATTTITNLSGDEKEITSSANFLNSVRKVIVNLTIDEGIAFNYGVQVGNGGFRMNNNSTIIGNVYSNGSIIGGNNNLIKGDIVSAGSSGFVSGVHSTSSVYAHSIDDSIIDGNAYYYNSLVNTTVGGNIYPNSEDKPSIPFPISQDDINEWESSAAAISTINSPCPYIINSSRTLGPVKISCDLKINGGVTITLLGTVWVSGNIETENSVIFNIDPSLGKKSVVMIADNPSNKTTSSKIIPANNVEFHNSGTKGSYIMMLSENNSAELGGSEKAIDTGNSIFGDIVFYSNHGEINIKNNISLKEITAYKISLQNSASIKYEKGLANTLFKSGPGGGYEINKWQEIN